MEISFKQITETCQTIGDVIELTNKQEDLILAREND